MHLSVVSASLVYVSTLHIKSCTDMLNFALFHSLYLFQWCLIHQHERMMPFLFSSFKNLNLCAFLVAGQRHHGWGRKNSLTKEAVAKIVDDTYRLNFIVS